MDTPVPTAARANQALWMHYLDAQWDAQLRPFGGVLAAGMLGMAVANYYTAFWGDVIGRMFAANARQVTEFVQASGADVLPRWTATPLPPRAPEDAVPPWLRILGEDAPRANVPAAEERATVGAA
jgi:hypothetical protein